MVQPKAQLDGWHKLSINQKTNIRIIQTGTEGQRTVSWNELLLIWALDKRKCHWTSLACHRRQSRAKDLDAWFQVTAWRSVETRCFPRSQIWQFLKQKLYNGPHQRGHYTRGRYKSGLTFNRELSVNRQFLSLVSESPMSTSTSVTSKTSLK